MSNVAVLFCIALSALCYGALFALLAHYHPPVLGGRDRNILSESVTMGLFAALISMVTALVLTDYEPAVGAAAIMILSAPGIILPAMFGFLVIVGVGTLRFLRQWRKM